MTFYELANIIISLLLPTAVGYTLVRLLCRHVSLKPLPALAVAYGLGMGILSQIMLLLGIMDIPYSRWTVGFFLLLALLAMIPSLLRKNKSVFSVAQNDSSNFLSVWDTVSESSISLSREQKIFCLAGLLYILYNSFFIIWRPFHIPVESWDAVATVTMKAKIFFFDHSLRNLALPRIAYPLHVSFLQAWTALNLGRWDDVLVNTILPFTFLSYLILNYYFLKSRTNAVWAVGGLCLLLASNFFVYHATIPYSDFSLMYYNCTTIIFLLLWAEKKHMALLILASLFAGFTTFVKLEGTIYLGLHTLLLFFILQDKKISSKKEKWINVLTFILPSYGIASMFHLYKNLVGITGMEERLNFSFPFDHLQRFPAIIDNLGLTFFESGNWNMLWMLLAVGVLSSWPKIKQEREIRVLGMLLGIFFAVYFVFFALTQTRIDYYTTLSRVILHFFPLVTWLIIFLYYPKSSRPADGQLHRDIGV